MKKLPFPNRVTVEPTNDCNLSCSMCPRHKSDMEIGYMDESLWLKIIKEMVEHRPITMVPFFRGETLLHDDWKAFFAMASLVGIDKIQLATNATMMNQRASLILSKAVSFISFSVDTLDPLEYDMIRNNKLTSVLSNIFYFLSINREVETQISMVDMPGRDVAGFVNFWTPFVDRVRAYRQHSQDGNFGSYGGGTRTEPCRKPFEEMVIYWNGDVALCNHDWDRKEPLGNVKNQSLKEIWDSPTYEEIREQHLTGKIECLPCKYCNEGYSDGTDY